MSASASYPPTKYKQVAQWEVDDYMSAIDNYNRPYRSLVRRNGDRLLVQNTTVSNNYDPPYPPWIDRAGGGSDNVFDYELGAYKAQLTALKNRTGNMANPSADMVEILNRPPVPRPPPARGLVNGVSAQVVQNTARPSAQPATSPPPAGSTETVVEYNARLYRTLYEDGRRMFSTLTSYRFPYESAVAFEPPAQGDTNYAVQEKFFELYDNLRQLWADEKGDEPFFIVMPRYKQVVESFRSSAKEGFRGSAKEGFLAGRTCAPYSPSMAWFNNYSSAREAQREQMKIDFCAGLPGYEFIAGADSECPTNCYLKATSTTPVVPAGGSAPAASPSSYIAPGLGSTSTATAPQATMADGITPVPTPTPATTITGSAPPWSPPTTYIGNTVQQVKDETKKYLYNWYNFDQTGNIEAVSRQTASYGKDAYAYKMSQQPQFKVADISGYYDMLTTYNNLWLNKYGWRDTSNKDRPYNPPIPIWLDPEDEPDDKDYMDALATYNDKVKNLLRQYMNNSPTVRLPADFNPLPDPPVYPSLLKDLLINPSKYADKQQGGSEIPPAQPDVSYTIPTAYLQSMLQAARDKLQFTMTTSSSAAPGTPGGAPLPKCSNGQCKKYSDYVPDFVKKYFDEKTAQSQQKRVQSGFLDYAFSRPY
jgi:hypothetical protein